MANWFTNMFTTPIINRVIPPVKKPRCANSKEYHLHSGVQFGDNTRMGIHMMYDGLITRHASFTVPYVEFETSILWLLGAIIDIEAAGGTPHINPKKSGKTHYSAWDKDTTNINVKTGKAGAYGRFQILNNDWTTTALGRWKRLSKKWDANTPNRTFKISSKMRQAGKMMTTKTLTFGKQEYRDKNGKVAQTYNNQTLIPKYPEFNQKSTHTGVSAWDRILEAVLIRNRSPKDIIEFYSPDIISALVVAHLAEAPGSDKWLVQLHTRPTDAAKIIYYRGHHLSDKYSKNDNDLLAGLTVDPRITAKANIKFNCMVPKAANISPKIGGGVLGPIDPKVPCHGDFTIGDVVDAVDHIFSTLDVKSGFEYLEYYRDRDVLIEDVTDHIPPSTSLLLPGHKEVPGMTHTFRIWNYVYSPLRVGECPTCTKDRYVAETTYIVTSDEIGLEQIKKDLRKYMVKEIIASAHGKELSNAVKVSFYGKHPAYIFGCLKTLREPVSLLSFLIREENLDSIGKLGNGNRQNITIGPHTLHMFKADKTNYVGVIQISGYFYPSPTFEANFRKERSFTTKNGDNVRILNDWPDIVQSIAAWAKVAAVKEESPDGAKYLKDHINDGNMVDTGAVLGYHDTNGDRTVITLITPDMTQTFLHEVGAHRYHNLGWGAGDNVLFSSGDIIKGRIELKLFKEHAYKDARLTYDIYNDQIVADYAKGLDGSAEADYLYDQYIKAADVVNKIVALIDHPIVKNILPLTDSIYTPAKAEDEFMARMYGTMAMNRCLTFQNDVYPLLKDMGISVVTDEIAYEIDRIMREDMQLDMRTYGPNYARYDPFKLGMELKDIGYELPKDYHPFLGKTGEEVTYTSISDGSNIYNAIVYRTEFESDELKFNTIKGLLSNMLLTASVLGTERDSTLTKVASTLYEVLYKGGHSVNALSIREELIDIRDQIGGIWTTPPDWLLGRYFKADIITGHVWAGFDTNGTFKIYRKRF